MLRFFPFVVLQADPLTRSRALDTIADRLRDQFGGALQALYVLPDNPDEPAGDDEWVVLAAVLGDSYYGKNDTSQQASEIGCALEGDRVAVRIHHLHAVGDRV